MRFLIVFLSIVCMAASPAAATDKYGDGPQAIDSDPSSTLDLGSLTAALPLDTVSVPLYLSTANSITYIENRINWNEADLSFIGVSLGAGLPDTVSLAVISQSAGEVRFKFTVSGDAVAVGTEPIAYLAFAVQCFGYGATTPVTLFDDGNYNFYVSGGIPAAPLRDNGSVATQYESWLFLWGTPVSAYVGQQDIPWTVTFYQEIPGRIESVSIQYDYTAVSMDSLTELPGLDGGSVTVSFHVAGVLLLDVNTPFLSAGEYDLFTLHFSMLDDRDATSTYVAITNSSRLNECGETETPSMWGASITIPNHTASADLGAISRTTSATYYDVPFVMDSNNPVNAYELRVAFPASQIYFDGVVAVAGFTSPAGNVDPGDTTVVNLNNGSGTNYLPSALPTTVCYLRFRPWTTPSAGTVFNLTFVNPHPENEVQYYTDLGAFHDAAITALSPGSITITGGGGGPGPCCPALYAWNGSGYDLDNNILAQCDGRRVTADVTDYYLVTKPVVADGDVLRFEIRENASAVSEFSDFELLVVDRPSNREIHVTSDGTIVAADQPFGIQWARDHTGRDITEVISARDNVVYQSKGDGWIEVSLGNLSRDQVKDFAASTHDALAKQKICDDLLHVQGVDLDKSRKLEVSIRTADGGWQVLSVNDARHNPARQATVIPPEALDTDREVVLRYSWESYYRIDVLEFSAATPFDGTVVSAPILDASRAEGDAVVERISAGGDGRLTLSAGGVITVAFDASDLPALESGRVREYVFVATGKYNEPSNETDVSAHAFTLGGNVPNPFNPTTTIHYSLGAPTHVELSVYDVRGALVRTLVSEHQAAGDRSVVWDGRSEDGTALSSGVYFYRLRAGSFTQTRKMVLLK